MNEALPAEPWSITLFKLAAEDIAITSVPLWHASLQNKFPLHPTVRLMLESHAPANWKTLLMQWPHISEKDPTRLAYTRSEADGAANRQLITSIGKYLTRHWPHVADHYRRDALMLYTPDLMCFVHTTAEMIMAVNEGPASCMRWNNEPLHKNSLAWRADPETNEEPDWTEHPYSCYDPKHGWHMALRYHEGRLDGRALCNGKDFVRTFKRDLMDPIYGYSYSDEALQAWLLAQGYQFLDSWLDDTKLTSFQGDNGWWAPYLDGETQRASSCGDHTLIIDENGELDCTSDNGWATWHEDDHENESQCEDCDDWRDEDELWAVGRHEGRYVCRNCLDSNYTEVRGRTNNRPGYQEYYLPNDDARRVENHDYYIDPEYLPDNVIELENGNYAEKDDCVCINDEYYLSDDNDVVELANGDYAKIDDCVLINNEYYLSDDNDVVELANGDYAKIEDCVCINDEYYLSDDSDVVELANGDYAKIEDCVCINDEYYLSDDSDVVEVEEEDEYGSTAALGDDCWRDFDDKYHRDDIEFTEYEGQLYVAGTAPNEEPVFKVVRDKATMDFIDAIADTEPKTVSEYIASITVLPKSDHLACTTVQI